MTVALLNPQEQQQLYDLAKAMIAKSYAPYSKFYVGAAIKTKTGNYYAGCNIENASYPLAQCAEASAIANMVGAGEQTIVAAVIVSSGNKPCAPCGACRQRFREFADSHLLVYMYDDKGHYELKTLDELLPISFGPEHLIV